MTRAVSFDRYGNPIPLDDERRIARDGESLIVNMRFMESIQKGNTKMTVSTVVVDGKEMSAEDVVRALEAKDGEIAALKAQQSVQDAQAVARQAATLRLRDQLRADNAAQADPSTVRGARAQQLRDAWKQPSA